MANQLVLPGTNEEFVVYPATLLLTGSNLSASTAFPSWYTMGCKPAVWVVEVLSMCGTRTEEQFVIKKLLFAVIASQRTQNNFRRTLRENFYVQQCPF
eukprot:6207175-Amphidinium_carterae.1